MASSKTRETLLSVIAVLCSLLVTLYLVSDLLPVHSATFTTWSAADSGSSSAGSVVQPTLLQQAKPKGPCMEPVAVNITKTCDFKNCPVGGPYWYALTSYRNRGSAINRWVRTLLEDVKRPESTVPAACTCVAVADYADELAGAPLEAALEDWPHSTGILKVPGKFSRAGGFQLLTEHLVTTDPKRSAVFLVDADMIAYPGLMDQINEKTLPNETVFAPVCWSADDEAVSKDWYSGKWRFTGTGMVSFYMSDFLKMGGCMPLAGRTDYGSEDATFTEMWQTKSNVRFTRACAPTLWHLYHKKKPWGWSADGIHKREDKEYKNWSPEDDWKLPMPKPDGAQELFKRGKVYTEKCGRITWHTYVT